MDKLGCHQILPLATGDAAKNQEADFRCVSMLSLRNHSRFAC